MRLPRTVLGFLLALFATGCATLALGVMPLAVAAVAVSFAALVGFAAPGGAGSAGEGDRAAVHRATSLWTVYGLLLGGSFFVIGFVQEQIVTLLVQSLVVAELVFLVLPELGRRGVPLLVNSLALSGLATVIVPALAPIAIGGVAVIGTQFILVDHYHERRARLRSLALPVFLHAAFAVGVTWPLLAWLAGASGPSARSPGSADLRVISRDEMFVAFGKLALWTVVGVGLIWFLGRLLKRTGEAGESEPDELELAAEAGSTEALSDWLGADAVDATGARGRVLRRFVRFLEQAAALGYLRRPSWTPQEFARKLPTPASRLARLFVRARYSEAEISETEAEAASADADEVLGRLRDLG